jgi:hypothetical protein
MRKAFSMITAIFVIVILATIAMLALRMVASTSQSTTIQYRKEQAQLYAKGYTELAVMAVTQYGRSANCINNIAGTTGDGYTISGTIRYIGAAGMNGACNRLGTTTAGGGDSIASVVIDMDVSYADASTSQSTIVYHKRTIKKI